MTDHPAVQDDRTVQSYAFIRTGNGEYIIYDQETPTAWIQSDTINPVTENM